MLSYMVPSIEEKPPSVPNKSKFALNHSGTNGHALVNGADMLVTTPSLPSDTVKRTEVRGVVKSSTISTESSASSLSSGVGDLAATHGEKAKTISNGGTKLQSHKRVSFGSSKGSMVETLVYESPVQEEPEVSPTPDPSDTDSVQCPSKVRVTFFEQERPLVVSSPEPEVPDDLDAPFNLAMSSPSPLADHAAPYHRQTSTDSGWDNPFRPDGDLSREADEIVELIKGGKPITPTPGAVPPQPTAEAEVSAQSAAPVTTSKGANGTANAAPKPGSPPGAVELQRATVSPSDASQVEHVVLKKKPKCKCCVIQ